jgi:hypothetical protein
MVSSTVFHCAGAASTPSRLRRLNKELAYDTSFSR